MLPYSVDHGTDISDETITRRPRIGSKVTGSMAVGFGQFL